eukprot:IDg11551t1
MASNSNQRGRDQPDDEVKPHPGGSIGGEQPHEETAEKAGFRNPSAGDATGEGCAARHGNPNAVSAYRGAIPTPGMYSGYGAYPFYGDVPGTPYGSNPYGMGPATQRVGAGGVQGVPGAGFFRPSKPILASMALEMVPTATPGARDMTDPAGLGDDVRSRIEVENREETPSSGNLCAEIEQPRPQCGSTRLEEIKYYVKKTAQSRRGACSVTVYLVCTTLRMTGIWCCRPSPSTWITKIFADASLHTRLG